MVRENCFVELIHLNYVLDLGQTTRRGESERWFMEAFAGIVNLRSAHGLWLIGEYRLDQSSRVYLDRYKGEWYDVFLLLFSQ